MAGSMDVAMNTHAVMLEKRYQGHIMSYSTPSSAWVNGRICVRGFGCFTVRPAGFTFGSAGIALAAMSILAFRWLPLPSHLRRRESGIRRHDYVVCTIRRASLFLHFRLCSLKVRSPIGARFSSYFGSHWARMAALGYAVFSGAMAGGPPDRRLSHRKLGRGHLVCYGALLAAARACLRLVVRQCGWAVGGLRALERVWPRLFPIVCRCREH